jgi:hypothetical protein
LADNAIEAVAPSPVKLMLIGLVTPLAVAVALICAVPTDPAEYTIAVAIPEAFVFAVIEAALFEKLPRVVSNNTCTPLLTGSPVTSYNVAVIVENDVLSAGMEVGLADNTMEAVAPGPVKLILMGLVTPLAVALICAVPTDPAEYTTAVATPRAFVVAVIESALFEKFPRFV